MPGGADGAASARDFDLSAPVRAGGRQGGLNSSGCVSASQAITAS